MERTIKKILFTTDLSPEARQVFAHVKKLVASTGAAVTVVHILEEVDMGTEEMMSHFLGEKKWKQFKADKIDNVKSVLIGKINETKMIKEAIGCFLENLKSENESELHDKIIVEAGVPSDKIVAIAKADQCEIIVAGREKRKVLGVTYIGRTLKDMIKKSDIPVLIVPYEKEKK